MPDLIDVKDLEDEQLRSLFNVVYAEIARRDMIKAGLDVGERLQFDLVVTMIRERTKLSVADALELVRTHQP